MTKFIQTLVGSLAVGSNYALIALGYTMVYGILQFINFAHSDIFMVGAWASYLIATAAGWTAHSASPILAVIGTLCGAMAVCATLGFFIELLAYRPLRNAPRLNVLITAIGVSLLLENAGQLDWIFGKRTAAMPALVPDRVIYKLAGVDLRLVDLLGISITIILMGALDWLVFRTRMGRAMRAVSFNPTVASLMGIPVSRVVSSTFVLGSALAGAAGFLFSMKYPINQPAQSTWILLGLKAFVAAVVGGIGNIRGAVLGGLLIGFIEQFGGAYYSPDLKDIYVFALLIIVLLVRPNGILGRNVMEKF